MMRQCLTAIAMIGLALSAQPYRDRLGVEIDGFGDSARSRPFVDHAKLHRPCTEINGAARVATDELGWPTSDAQCVIFDVRAIPAWAPPIDDPEEFQPDWSGDWRLSFEGQAEITISSGGGTITDLSYDALTNVSSARLVVNRGTGLIVLAFRNTRRTAASSSGTGFRALRMIRPGYAARPSQIYTDEFLRSFRPFRILRYMDFSSTNSVTPSAAVSDLLEWRDRKTIADATQQSTGRKVGVAWEYAIQLANQTGTDMWINIPVSASENYIGSLARLIQRLLNPGLRIYIESGNEVWNPLFANSYNYNRNAARDEVAAGGSNLNSDGQASDIGVAARRRHLRRVIDAVRSFREILGVTTDAPGDLDNWRVRGVFAWWTIFPDQYRTTLAWGRATYGPLNQHIYAIANTHYYNVSRATPTDTPERLVEVMQASSDAGVTFDNQFREMAAEHGLKHTIYEGGPDVGGGSTTNVANRIRANRLAAMGDLVKRDIKTNWFDRGSAEYMQFSHVGACSRFGCWGAAEDVMNLDTPKMNALVELSGARPDPVVSAIVNAGSFTERLSPGAFATLIGSNLTTMTGTWEGSIVDGLALPSMLGGVQVKFAGKSGAVSYVSPGQVNVIVPPDARAGPVEVEVFTQNGVWRGMVTLESVSPAFFGHSVDGRFYASALGAARPGNIVELYMNGLGPTASAVPPNERPLTSYAVADLSRIRVTLGGQPADVLFAGVTFAGLYQVNVRIPAGLAAGDQPLAVRVDGAAAQDAFLRVSTN